MKTTIVTMSVPAENVEKFEKIIKKMVRFTNENEPGCMFYQAFRDDASGTYIVIEVYKDDDALVAHRATANFMECRPQLAALWSGTPSIMRPVVV